MQVRLGGLAAAARALGTISPNLPPLRPQTAIQHMLWHELAVPLHADVGDFAGRPGTLVVDKQLLVSWRDAMRDRATGQGVPSVGVARAS